EVKLHFSSYEVVALASLVPIEANQETFNRRLSSPQVKADLRAIRTDADRFFAKVSAGLRSPEVSERGQLNTDDNVFLEHQLPWDFFFDRNFILEGQRAR